VNTAIENEIPVGDPNFMTSLARSLSVVQGFSREKRHMSISELGRKTGKRAQ
jgi:IclR family transcriptional regulator, pca regulon regulatory protein